MVNLKLWGEKMNSLKRKTIFLICSVLICCGVIADDPAKSDSFFYGNFSKSASVAAVSDISVIPGGNAVGIKLYTKGLLAINVTSFECSDGRIVSPAGEAGMKAGDVILEINSKDALGNKNFAGYVNENGDKPINLTVQRGEKKFALTVTAQIEKHSGEYKIGAWVRDSAAGIGTVTFTQYDTGKFVALGHSIIDSDIGIAYKVEHGTVEPAEIVGISKGQKGIPGELEGVFMPQSETIGYIEKNDSFGLYGRMNTTPEGEAMKVASRWQVKEGPAEILTTVDNSGVKKYAIEIQKISYASSASTKSMIIRITDDKLLEATGGIVQGMSGSPIIQNGKLVGAITHVLVNDPTRGYGIFIENMLSQTEKIE